MASGVRTRCRCRSTLSSHSSPGDPRAFATAADGQPSGTSSDSPTMAKFDGTHKKWGGLMTACTQPGCIGVIVDGYCDVCGSPAGAVPFVPVKPAASAASPAFADEPALTAASHGSGYASESTNARLDTAC